MPYSDAKRRFNLIQYIFLLPIGITLIVMMNYVGFSLGGDGLYLPFNNTTWIGFAFFMLIGICIIAYRGRLRLSNFHAVYSICVVLLFLPLLYTDRSYLKYEYTTILAVVAALLVVFLAFQFALKRHVRAILLIIYLSTIIQSVWGMVQYYFIFEPNILFLVAEHGVPVGVFNQVNVFSTYVNLGSLLAIYFYFTSKKQNLTLLLTTLFVLIVNAHLDVLANTQTGRVISLIALGIYLTHLAYTYQKYTLPIVMLLTSLLCSFMPKQWFDVRPDQNVKMSVDFNSLGTRPILYSLGSKLALEKPLTGHGIGQVRYKFAKHIGEYKKENPEYNSITQAVHLHNEVLQWFMQHGVVSISAFFIVFGFWIWGLKNGMLESKILFLGLPFLGHSLLEFPFYTSNVHLLIFAIILALSIKRSNKLIKFSNPFTKSILPIMAVLIAFQITSFMLASLTALKAITDFQNAEAKDITKLEKQPWTPAMSLYLEIEKFEWTLDNGFKTGQINQEDIFAFIDWAESIKGYFAVNKVYVRLAQSYLIAQNYEAANKTMDEALLLFPDDEQVIEMVARMKAFMK